jgi:hypothetical protein
MRSPPAKQTAGDDIHLRMRKAAYENNYPKSTLKPAHGGLRPQVHTFDTVKRWKTYLSPVGEILG